MERLTKKYNGKNIVKSDHIAMVFNNETGNRFEGEAIEKLAAYEIKEEILGKIAGLEEDIEVLKSSIEEAKTLIENAKTVTDLEQIEEFDFEKGLNIIELF